MKKTGLILLIILTAFLMNEAKASHAQGSDIIYVNLAPNTYLVTYNFFRDCSGISAATTETLTYRAPGCHQGSSITLTKTSTSIGSPYCFQIVPTCNPSSLPNYQLNVYTGTLVLPQQCDNWLISTKISNRNNSRNLVNASSHFFYSEALLNTVAAPANTSPDFNSMPVFYVCKDEPFVFNNYIRETDGDSISFELVSALQDLNTPVAYMPGFSASNPLGPNSNPPFTMNSATGEITATINVFDTIAPSNAGMNKYAVVIQVNEFREISPNFYVKIGHVRRDMLITVSNCHVNSIPTMSDISYNGNVYNTSAVIDIAAGKRNDLRFSILDQDIYNRHSVYSNIVSVFPGSSMFISGSSRPNVTLMITPQQSHIRNQPYYLTINYNDDACPTVGQGSTTIALRVVDSTTVGIPDKLAKKYTMQNMLSLNGNGNLDRLIIDPELEGASLSIYSPEGRLIRSYKNYDNSWKATDVAAGMYIYQVQHPVSGQLYRSRLMVVK